MKSKTLLILVLITFPCSNFIFAQTSEPPTSVTVVTDSLTRNLVTWIDETVIIGETYNIYISENEITSIHSSGVVKVGRNIPEGKQRFLHTLYTPADTGMVNYFYSVTSVDPDGIENETIVTGGNTTAYSTENKAIAVGCIPLVSREFIIDGDIGEFQDIIPFVMDSACWVEGEWDGIEDLSALVYLMMDQENMYLAVVVKDNALVQNFEGFGAWNGDSFEMNIGLYSLQENQSHTRFSRGEEPDYQYRLSINEEAWLHVPWPGRPNSGPPNHVINYVEMVVTPTLDGYIIEAKFPFAEIMADPKMTNHPGGSDSLFIPEDGMVIPIDFTLNDADVDVYEGHIYYFWEGNKTEQPRPYESPQVWSRTIIGNFQTSPNVIKETNKIVPTGFTLFQNYPNPFNPKTTIMYFLERPQKITLSIFSLTGELVNILVDGRVDAGTHFISWDGLDKAGFAISNGVYIYCLETEDATVSKKMVILK